MKILVTGLCTLHWGRLEFGNVGNYYIVEPLFRELHRIFPEDEIVTTFQMTDKFIKRENITTLPMDMYYGWSESDIPQAQKEYHIAKQFSQENYIEEVTPYIEILKETSILINVSGDMWGDNAEHVGHGRFLTDLLKMRTAQLMGVKTVLFGVTPGPFTDQETVQFAKEVYENFDLVVNRESVSTKNLSEWGFRSKCVKDFACPAFLYEPELSLGEKKELEALFAHIQDNKKIIGFTIGGFNMPIGPYDMWPRDDCQYNQFVDVIEHVINDLGARIVLISHTNGFELPPNFKLKNGRDYSILKQLQTIILNRGNVEKEDLICIDTPYLPRMIKSIIGRFDMMITGRVHASVAAMSQCVPTVFLNYESSFIPSTKMYGFAQLAGVDEFVCDPKDHENIRQAVDNCFESIDEIHRRLEKRIPEVKKLAKEAFDEIKKLDSEKLNLKSTSLMVTERCTLRCKLCLSYTPYYKNPQVLKVEEAEAILKRYFKLVDTVEKFSITGGEPMTNPHIYEIMQLVYCYSKQITGKIIFITNGTVSFPAKMIQLFSDHQDKTRVIINDYGNGLSREADANYERLKQAGLKQNTILYREDNRYGWVDCRDHQKKHFTIEERELQAATCEFHKGKKYIIDRGELHSCTRSFYRMLTGIIPHNSDEFIDLRYEGSIAEDRNKLRHMLRSKSSTSCAYCSGLTETTVKYPAAEQLKSNEKSEC